MKKISQILSEREMFSVDENQSVAEVARTMAERHVGAILVLGDGKLKGIFSERDLMTRVIVDGRNVDSTRVGEVMTTNLATTSDDVGIEDAMNVMRQVGCRHLPVLRNDQVLGMVSMRDLMNLELEQKTEEINHMRSYIHG